MLSRSGAKLKANMEVLLDFTQPVLDSSGNPLCNSNGVAYTLFSYLVEKGFTPSNISSMLHNSQAKLAVNIAALFNFTKPVLDFGGNPLYDANDVAYTVLSYLKAQGLKC